MAWSCYWLWKHSSLKSSTSAQKSRFEIRPNSCRQGRYGSIARKNPLGVSIQLWIFPSCDPIRAIDALLRRFGSQQVASFIGHRWTCSNFWGTGMGATIRLCMLALQLRPVGAESRSILPRYVSKNGRMWIADISIVGNPLHLNTLTSKTKRIAFSSTSPSRCHYLRRYMNLPQTIDGKASSRIVYTQSEDL